VVKSIILTQIIAGDCNMKRTVYLEDIPLEETWSIFKDALKEAHLWQPLPSELVALAESCGRVTAEAVWAKLSSPHYHASAMDGYAIRALDSDGATETSPVRLLIVSRGIDNPQVDKPAQPVNTGQPMPSWADAVVMIENTQPGNDQNGQSYIEIRASLPPWHHVRQMGEDMVATELVLPANHRLRPVDIGALAGSGHTSVMVYQRPKVTIIPTGSELITIEEAADLIQPGQIIEYNSLVLGAQIDGWGGISRRQPIVADRFKDIQKAVLTAAEESDLVLINAGSSAGSEDYTAQVIDSLGRVLIHGVAVRPGHPVIIGLIDIDQRKVPVFGVPGYPVSAALTGEIFIEPLLAKWQGQPPYQPPTLKAFSTRKITSHTGDDDFVRVAVGKVGDTVMATPISRGAGVISSLVRADGIVRVPRFSEGVDIGAEVTVQLYRSPAEINKTIVAIGSHDLSLDLLAQFLAAREDRIRLTSANVGSLGGLFALRRGHSHIAGSHLLDPESGQYNVSYLKQYLPEKDVVLVTLVGREQGWIVQKGNPKDLKSWDDLRNSEISFVNRQRGAGTRMLLDYHLEQHDIDASIIQGYEREEFTHLAVAAAVASQTADAGLGIRAAALALNLDFVPLAQERYDLVIPREYYQSKLLEPLFALLKDDEFQAAVAAMPGYDVSKMGDIVSQLD
jgi:putative molybdopterin biosynthesis protein